MFKNLIVRNKVENIVFRNGKDKVLTVYDVNNGIEEQTNYWAFTSDLTKDNLEEFFPKEYLDRYMFSYNNYTNKIVIGVDFNEK